MGNENELKDFKAPAFAEMSVLNYLGRLMDSISATACAVGVPLGQPTLPMFLRIRRTSVGFLDRNQSNVTNCPKPKGLPNSFAPNAVPSSPWSTGMVPNSSSRQGLSSKVLKPIPRKTSSGIRKHNGMSMGWKLQGLRSIKVY